MCTDHGRAVLELADEAAPLNVGNFLRYVDMGYYSGTVFHRVIPGFIVQAGGVDRELRVRPTLAAVANESNNGLKNERGTVAAARTDDPDSAQSQFFVNIGDNTRLDGSNREPGYTVFARVTEGLEMFEAIGELPTGTAGPLSDVPTPLVAIKSIVRFDAAALAALPVDGRDAVLKAEIDSAVAAGSAADALRLIGQYRALCLADDPELALTEARMALAADERQRALFTLDELRATTDASLPVHQAATTLYAEATQQVAATPQAVAGCEPPMPPQLADASLASEDEMIASQRQVRAFVARGEAHLACLAKVIDDEDREADERNMAVGEHNRMVAAMEQIAAGFNEQIKIFKSRG